MVDAYGVTSRFDSFRENSVESTVLRILLTKNIVDMTWIEDS